MNDDREDRYDRENRENREHVYREARKPFDFNRFFSRKSNKVFDQYGATVLITSHQAITIPNVDEYTGLHEKTQEKIVEVIYDLKNQSTSARKRLIEQAIRMRLINESGEKMIAIEFPDRITLEQVSLLKAYQDEYGLLVERFSLEYVDGNNVNLPMVVFQDGNGDDNNSHSFSEAVKYAQTLPRTEKQDTPDEIIIGQVISQNGSNLCKCSVQESLRSFVKKALVDRGVSLEGCQSFWTYIKEKLNEKRGAR